MNWFIKGTYYVLFFNTENCNKDYTKMSFDELLQEMVDQHQQDQLSKLLALAATNLVVSTFLCFGAGLASYYYFTRCKWCFKKVISWLILYKFIFHVDIIGRQK